jgi:AraC-like DNA-binding protein
MVFSQLTVSAGGSGGTMPFMPAETTWITFTSPDIWLGEFRLPPDHRGWHEPNVISDRAPLIAFPRTAVRIGQEAKPWIVADPTRAALYPAGQPYRRELVSTEGDRCSFITFSRELAADAASSFDRRAHDPLTYRFPFVAAQVDTADYERHQRTRKLLADSKAEPGQIREELYGLLGRVVASGYAGRAASHAKPTMGARDAVDAVRTAIGRDLSVTHSLDELGALACLSPFHLARVFRSVTGSSIHAHRTQVRLRSGLARIADGDSLADVAADVGFSSQAHLTDRFHREFGVAPHAWRREMSTIVKAREELARLA